MTAYAYRPRINWMQGTEVRSVASNLTMRDDEIEYYGSAVADVIHGNGCLTVESESGNFYSIPGRLVTEVCYQRVEVADAHRPETTTTTEQGHCCTEGSPCRNGGGTMAAPLRHVCDTVHVDADEYDACEQRSVELAEQEARHPGLGRLLNALVTQLPPDDPDRCAETLAAMDAAVPRNGARDCPCWPGQCTCDATPGQ